jgi:hypothetical protein
VGSAECGVEQGHDKVRAGWRRAAVPFASVEFSISFLGLRGFGGVVVAIVIVAVIEGGGDGGGEGEEEDEDGADFDDVKRAFEEPGVDEGGVGGMIDFYRVGWTNFDDVVAG